jgi:hypothetical protein
MSEDNQTQATAEAPMAQQPQEQLVLPKVICEKHGDVGAYHFTLHAPEFGYDQAHYCLICAMDYINMIAQPVKAVYPEDDVAEVTSPDAPATEPEQKTEGASE